MFTGCKYGWHLLRSFGSVGGVGGGGVGGERERGSSCRIINIDY